MSIWNSGCVDEVDPFRLWLFELMSFIVCWLWERWKSGPILAFYMASSDVTAGSNLLWWNGTLCWSKIWLTGRQGATILPVTPNRPTSPVSQSNFFLLAKEIHSIQWGRSHYECWKSSHLNNNEKKDTKNWQLRLHYIYIFCPNRVRVYLKNQSETFTNSAVKDSSLLYSTQWQ